MNAITEEQLSNMLDGPDAQARAQAWVAALNASMEARDISTPARQSAFLAQVLVESAQLKHVEENLRYSAPRLRAVWPKRFPSDAIAQAYAGNPEKLANKVYSGRLGNGNEASGDGWKYRGRGLIQLTGRDNYTRFGSAMGVDAVGNPDLLLQPDGAALSAAWFWDTNHLNALADEASEAGFVKICKCVNGGVVGLSQREAFWARVKGVVGVGVV